MVFFAYESNVVQSSRDEVTAKLFFFLLPPCWVFHWYHPFSILERVVVFCFCTVSCTANIIHFLLSLFSRCHRLRWGLCRGSVYIGSNGGRKHFSPCTIFCTHTSFIAETCSAWGNAEKESWVTEIYCIWYLMNLEGFTASRIIKVDPSNTFKDI